MSPTQEFFIAIKAVALISYLVLVFSVIQSKAERTVRLLFSVYLSGMLFWQFTSLMVSLARTAAAALLWYNLAVAGTGTANILFYPFVRAFTKGRRGVLSVAAYASCALMFVVGILGLTWREVVIGRGGYSGPPSTTADGSSSSGRSWYFFYGCGIFVLRPQPLPRDLPGTAQPALLRARRRLLHRGSGISTNLTSLRRLSRWISRSI